MAGRPKRNAEKPQRLIEELSMDRGSETPKSGTSKAAPAIKQSKRKRVTAKGIQHPKNLKSVGSAPLGKALLTKIPSDEPGPKRARRSTAKEADETEKKSLIVKLRTPSLPATENAGDSSNIAKLNDSGLYATKQIGESSSSGESEVGEDEDESVSNTGHEASSAMPKQGELTLKSTGLRRDSAQSLRAVNRGIHVPHGSPGRTPPMYARYTLSQSPHATGVPYEYRSSESFDPTVTPSKDEPHSFASAHADAFSEVATPATSNKKEPRSLASIYADAIFEPATPVQPRDEDYDTDQDTPVSSIEKDHHGIILLDDAYTPNEDRGETPIESLPRTTDSPYLFDETDFLEDESYGLKLNDNNPTRARDALIVYLRDDRDLINIQRKKIARDMEIRAFIRAHPKWDRWGFYENQKELMKKGAVGEPNGPRWEVNPGGYKTIYDVNPGKYDLSVTVMDQPRDLTVIRRVLAYAKVRYRYNWVHLASSFRDELPIRTMEFEAEIVEMIENVGFPKKLCEDVAGDIEEIDSDSDSDDDEEDPNEGQVQYQAQDDDDAYEEPYVFKYWAEEDEEEQE